MYNRLQQEIVGFVPLNSPISSPYKCWWLKQLRSNFINRIGAATKVQEKKSKRAEKNEHD